MKNFIVKNLNYSYFIDDKRIEVLKNVAFSCDAGSYNVIVGASGSGKTTFLKILAGLDQPESGDVIFEDINLIDLNDNELAELRLNKLGIVFQDQNLFDILTVEENVAYQLGIAGANKLERKIKARELIYKFGLSHRLKHNVNQLSGGEKKRVAICRALIMSPTILLIDEPITGLDKENQKIIMDTLMKLKKEGITLIVTSHEDSVKINADNVYNMDNGNLVKINLEAQL